MIYWACTCRLFYFFSKNIIFIIDNKYSLSIMNLSLNKKINVMVAMVIFVALVYALVITLFVMTRKAMRFHNPKHCFWDDILLFSGSPLLLGYLLILFFNPYNWDKIVFDLLNTPLTYCLMVWAVISTVIVLVRFEKNRNK